MQPPRAAPCCHTGSQMGVSYHWPVTARCWPAGASILLGRAAGQAAWATGPLHGPFCAFQMLPLCLQTPRPSPAPGPQAPGRQMSRWSWGQ